MNNRRLSNIEQRVKLMNEKELIREAKKQQRTDRIFAVVILALFVVAGSLLYTRGIKADPDVIHTLRR